MRTIDADRLIESMGEPKDYFEELVRNVVKDFVDEQPTIENDSAWIWQEYTNGFGTFKALRCERCGTKRNQVSLRYCASCGRKMINADEFGGEENA